MREEDCTYEQMEEALRESIKYKWEPRVFEGATPGKLTCSCCNLGCYPGSCPIKTAKPDWGGCTSLDFGHDSTTDRLYGTPDGDAIFLLNLYMLYDTYFEGME